MNNSKLKILQLGKFIPVSGGIEKIAFSLSQGVTAQGHICDYLCARNRVKREHENDSVVNFNIITAKTWAKVKSTCIAPAMMYKLRLLSSNYDIIHIHHPDPMAALSLYISGYKGKVLLHWHCDIVKQSSLKKIYNPLLNWLINRADIIVCTSFQYMMSSTDLINSVEKNKVIYIALGVSPVATTWLPEKYVKNKYSGKKIIFSLGRLVEYKGYKYLINSAKYLPDDYLVVIGGDGPLRNNLEKLIEDEGLQHKVLLLGHLSNRQKAEYMHGCDLFCLPSICRAEAFGIVMIEAMSCGKPIVSTSIPGSGVTWVNEDKVTGINVKICDEKALAGAFVKILSDNNLYDYYSQRAKKRYDDMFTNKKMINSFINVYKVISDEKMII